MKTSVLTLIAIAVSNALGESCAPGHLVCGHVLLGYSKYIRAILKKISILTPHRLGVPSVN